MIAAVASSVRRVLAIARNTFVEAARNRAFVGLGVAAVGLVVSSIVLSSLALSDQMSRVLIDFGLFVIGLLEVVIAVVLGVILVFKEIDRKTFYLVLPKPIRRSEVIVGKFLGLQLVLWIALMLMSTVWIASLVWRGADVRPDMFKALPLCWMEAALITAVALFFSSFATPVMSGVFTLGVFLVGRDLYLLQELLGTPKGVLATNEAARAIAKATVHVFPDLSVFNISHEVILDIPVGWDYVGGAGLYALGYVVVFLALAALVFERRDFV
jgi:ABC-type transport system involved in multi-copper enzyme maturation permease subunit